MSCQAPKGGKELTDPRGLQFDERFWVCGYCRTECVDYPTMKEHSEKRCKVRQAIQRRRAGQVVLTPGQNDRALAEGRKVLEEWGIR